MLSLKKKTKISFDEAGNTNWFTLSNIHAYYYKELIKVEKYAIKRAKNVANDRIISFAANSTKQMWEIINKCTATRKTQILILFQINLIATIKLVLKNK